MITEHLRRSMLPLAAMTLATAAALSGCTGDDEATPSPDPSTSTSATTEVTETVYDECVDGVATILADDLDGPFELGDCASVSVVGVDGDITLGVVDQLVLEGDRNTVTASRVGRIAFGGNGNVVDHGGEAPEVVDDGDDNVVNATN